MGKVDLINKILKLKDRGIINQSQFDKIQSVAEKRLNYIYITLCEKNQPIDNGELNIILEESINSYNQLNEQNKTLKNIENRYLPEEDLGASDLKWGKEWNCYQYAICGRERVPPNLSGKILPTMPGRGSFEEITGPESLKEKLILDGLAFAGDSDIIPKQKQGFYIIACVIDNFGDKKDFHFYRQDNNGWSHKPLNCSVSRLDVDGKTIANPAKASRDYNGVIVNDYKVKDLNYNKFVGFFYVPNEGVQDINPQEKELVSKLFNILKNNNIEIVTNNCWEVSNNILQNVIDVLKGYDNDIVHNKENVNVELINLSKKFSGKIKDEINQLVIKDNTNFVRK